MVGWGEVQKQTDSAFFIESLLAKTSSLYQLRSAYKLLSTIYKSLNTTQYPQLYCGKYIKINDCILSISKSIITEPLIELEEVKNRLYLIIVFIIFILLIAVYLAIKYFRHYQEEKRQKNEIQIELTKLEKKNNTNFEDIIDCAKRNDSYFLARFRDLYPDFYQKITNTYPNLTMGQLKFCAFLRLNFSTKEIAHYTNISTRSMEIKKNRLRKQLNIDSTEDINKWMMNF